MNIIRFKKAVAAIILGSVLIGLAGCWDSKEIDSLLIVTGVGLDKAVDDEGVDISMQIGKTKPSAPGAKESGGEDSNIILEAAAQTVLEGVAEINMNSSRTLLFHHNQVLLIDSELAKEGITKHLDAFIRDHEARLEVLIVIVDGSAKEILEADFEQERTSGIFIARTIHSLMAATPEYSIRMLEFASRLRDESTAPIALLVKMEEKDDKQKLSLEGMAVFDKEGKMTGRISSDEMRGYVWAMGEVEQGRVAVQCDYGRAALQIINMNCKRKVGLDEKGQPHVSFAIDATLNIGELRGFKNMTATEIIPHLIKKAEEEISDMVTGAFQSAQAMGTDIYGIGLTINRYHPKQWDKIKDSWELLFSKLSLDVEVNVKIPGTGQIKTSLEMEDE